MAVPITIERVNPLDVPDWDAEIAAWPSATFFHGQAWARVLHEAYGLTPLYFVARRFDRMVGVLPLIEIRSWITGRRGVGLPFTDRCEVLAQDDAVRTELLNAALTQGRRHGWKYCEIRDRPRSPGTAASISYFGHSLALNRAPESIFAACDSSARRAVRKAERSNIEVVFAHGLAAIDTFYELVGRTRQRHGLPPQPLRFFHAIHRHVVSPGRGCIALATLNGQAIAGALFLHFGPIALFKFGASNDRYQHLRANNLLMWRAIEWHANAGFRLLDFGRTSRHNEGLRRFKLGWGAQEHDIEYLRCDCRTGAPLREDDATQSWYTGIVQHLPRAIARILGAVAYRHIG